MSVIRILHPIEIKEYDSPPLFDSFGRKKFLTLPISLMPLLETSRQPSSKIALVIQCGYFRARHRFFGSQFRSDDIAFVAGRLNLPTPARLKLSKLSSFCDISMMSNCGRQLKNNSIRSNTPTVLPKPSRLLTIRNSHRAKKNSHLSGRRQPERKAECPAASPHFIG